MLTGNNIKNLCNYTNFSVPDGTRVIPNPVKDTSFLRSFIDN